MLGPGWPADFGADSAVGEPAPPASGVQCPVSDFGLMGAQNVQSPRDADRPRPGHAAHGRLREVEKPSPKLGVSSGLLY